MRISDWSSDVCSSDLRPADRPGGAVMSAVDVLAVLDLLSEHAGTLRPYAQDTGGFRVGNKGATELAAACEAAISVAEARAPVAELIEPNQKNPTAVEIPKAREYDPQ